MQIVPNAEGENGRTVFADVPYYDFEVRPRVAAAEPEILRREALRHYMVGEPEELEMAEAAIEGLLRIHPRSYEAFLMRGRIAEARGEKERARINYRRAAEILRNEQDDLLAKFKPREERQRLLRSLDSILRAQQ